MRTDTRGSNRCTQAEGEADLFGRASVCGESDVVTHLSGSGCHTDVDAFTALAVCRSVGARLCTEEELATDETRGTGCGFDARLVWSATRGTCRADTLIARAGNSMFEKEHPARCTSLHAKASVRCCADTRNSADKALQVPPSTAFTCSELGSAWNRSCMYMPRCNDHAVRLFDGAASTAAGHAVCTASSPATCTRTTPRKTHKALCHNLGARLCSAAELISRAGSVLNVMRGCGSASGDIGIYEHSASCKSSEDGVVSFNSTGVTSRCVPRGGVAFPVCCASERMAQKPCEGLREVALSEGESFAIAHVYAGDNSLQFCNWAVSCLGTSSPTVSITEMDLITNSEFIWAYQNRSIEADIVRRIQRFFMSKDAEWAAKPATTLSRQTGRLLLTDAPFNISADPNTTMLVRLFLNSNPSRVALRAQFSCRSPASPLSSRAAVAPASPQGLCPQFNHTIMSCPRDYLLGARVRSCLGSAPCVCNISLLASKCTGGNRPTLFAAPDCSDGAACANASDSLVLVFDRTQRNTDACYQACQGRNLIFEGVSRPSRRRVMDTSKPVSGGLAYLNARFVAKGGSFVTFRRLAVVGQISNNNGGFLSCVGCTYVIESCYIANNKAGGFGGAIQADTGSFGSITLTTFEDNEAKQLGGAIDSWGVVVSTRCMFRFNRAGFGGGISCCKGERGGGGVFNVTESKFEHNSAVEQCGGGLFVSKGALTLRHSSVSNNQASAGGGAICCDRGTFDVKHSTLRNNGATLGGNTVWLQDVEQWLLDSTQVAPFDRDAAHSVNSALPACSTNPCEIGRKCSYSKLSRTCGSCQNGTASLSGTQCQPCARGLQPSADHRSCIACADGTFSPTGVSCVACSAAGTYSNNETKQTVTINGDTLRVHISCAKLGLHYRKGDVDRRILRLGGAIEHVYTC